ncbi:MAG: CoA transferase [Chloroflexi bacterium]|nr:CoA transferase [Chloroflexota bacterium]|tara:strand:+ start:3316 stop:4518 length:1203 start_codon:yes stop_codon:yes gene_type:complete
MTSNQSLEGITVIDCSQILAGPFCSMLLADHGARVIKVEKPNGGDDVRGWGPPFIGNDSSAFVQLNRNKESISLDIKEKSGKEILKKLIKTADVLIENSRVGTMDKLGFGYDDVKKINSKIIYCSITGFGSEGPYSKRGGFDLIAQGMSGLMSITGHPDSPPAKVGVPIADLNTGMFAMQGILSAYIHRLKKNEGQYMEVSLLESALAYTMYESSIYFTTGKISTPDGSAHRLTAPYQAFKTKDGYINIGAANQSNWERLLNVLGLENLNKDPEFSDSKSRQVNRKKLEKILEKIFITKSSKEWINILIENSIPSGPIYNMKEVWEDEQVKYRKMDVELDHPKQKNIRNIGVAVKLSKTPGKIKTSAPLYGEHSIKILKELGYSEEEIKKLIKSNISGMG